MTDTLCLHPDSNNNPAKTGFPQGENAEIPGENYYLHKRHPAFDGMGMDSSFIIQHLDLSSLSPLLHHLRQNLSFDRQVLLPRPFNLARDLFNFSNRSVQRGSHLIEMNRKLNLNGTKNPFFTVRVIKPCHRLPIGVVESPTFRTFKTCLAMALSNLL